MNNCTNNDQNHQEYFGWIGNSIFIFAQLAQVLHTYRIKKTDDVSYILEIMWIVGNSMYPFEEILWSSFIKKLTSSTCSIT